MAHLIKSMNMLVSVFILFLSFVSQYGFKKEKKKKIGAFLLRHWFPYVDLFFLCSSQTRHIVWSELLTDLNRHVITISSAVAVFAAVRNVWLWDAL